MSYSRQFNQRDDMFFQPSPACPFCQGAGTSKFPLSYSETAEANASVPDASGEILECGACGVYYPSLTYDQKHFTDLYAKSLGDLMYFDDTLLQRIRRPALAMLIKSQAKNVLSSALQIPAHTSGKLAGLSVLDVGSGFGEFSQAYQQLGARVTATEVIQKLVDLNIQKGIDCRMGGLEDIDLPAASFDAILFRAVMYRTPDPALTLRRAAALLAPGGEISVIDPCVDLEGARYFAMKQFPQGRYYISDVGKYSVMLTERFGLAMVQFRQIYGRPAAPLKKVRFIGNLVGFGELVKNNLLKRAPYVGAYVLKKKP